MFAHLEQREVFHIAFLRQLTGHLKPNTYALKGGVNLRLFFKSLRYSEDMDIDIKGIELFQLREIVMEILSSKTLQITLRPFKIDKIVPPKIEVSKQTETTQRFKTHLITSTAEDLFTKIEFSRRGIWAQVVSETIDLTILQFYKLQPLIVSHYPVEIAIAQKTKALAERPSPQARDIFDMYMLLPRITELKSTPAILPGDIIKKAAKRIFDLDFAVFRNTVLNYLKDEDKNTFDRKESWEEIQLKVAQAIEGLTKK